MSNNEEVIKTEKVPDIKIEKMESGEGIENPKKMIEGAKILSGG